MKEFLAMGGYAAFVWPAFLITAFILGANVVAARKREAAVLAHLRRRRAAGGAAAGRRDAAPPTPARGRRDPRGRGHRDRVCAEGFPLEPDDVLRADAGRER